MCDVSVKLGGIQRENRNNPNSISQPVMRMRASDDSRILIMHYRSWYITCACDLISINTHTFIYKKNGQTKLVFRFLRCAYFWLIWHHKFYLKPHFCFVEKKTKLCRTIFFFTNQNKYDRVSSKVPHRKFHGINARQLQIAQSIESGI